jgi:hypothetical protein
MMSRNHKFFLGILLVFLIPLVLEPLIQSVYSEYKELNLKVIVLQNKARVVEEINPRIIVSTINIQAISSNISNILATDEKNTVLTTSQNGNIIRIDTLGALHVILTYNANILTKTSGIWNINYNSTDINSIVVFPPVSDIISVNNIPIDIKDGAITMPVGQVSISYVIRSVSSNNFAASWNDATFPIQIITASKVEKFGFDHNSKSIMLTLDNQAPMLVILPKSLVGGPYVVDLNGSPTQFKEYYQNATDTWIRVDPTSSGIIKITGTTVAVPEFFSVPLLIFVISMAIATLIFLNKKYITLKF